MPKSDKPQHEFQASRSLAPETEVDLGFGPDDLVKLSTWTMPFGRFKDWRIIDLPEDYLFWFRDKGWPKGKLGHLMRVALQLKVDGADKLVKNMGEDATF